MLGRCKYSQALGCIISSSYIKLGSTLRFPRDYSHHPGIGTLPSSTPTFMFPTQNSRLHSFPKPCWHTLQHTPYLPNSTELHKQLFHRRFGLRSSLVTAFPTTWFDWLMTQSMNRMTICYLEKRCSVCNRVKNSCTDILLWVFWNLVQRHAYFALTLLWWTFLLPQHTILPLSIMHKTKYSPKPKQKHSKFVVFGGFTFKVESNSIDVKLVFRGEGRIWFKVQPDLSILTFIFHKEFSNNSLAQHLLSASFSCI